jgi:hypothetical protein
MFDAEYLEEEFTGQINSRTVFRILGLARNHRRWLVGFLFTISLTSTVDSYFTFLGKRIIDEGILAGAPSNRPSIWWRSTLTGRKCVGLYLPGRGSGATDSI